MALTITFDFDAAIAIDEALYDQIRRYRDSMAKYAQVPEIVEYDAERVVELNKIRRQITDWFVERTDGRYSMATIGRSICDIIV